MMLSNCLFEAIKAKLKDPKHVKIIYLPKCWNEGQMHFMWIKDDKVFHYEAKSKHDNFLFKGTIKSQSLDIFERFILHKLCFPYRSDNIKFAKSLHLPSTEAVGFLDWGYFNPEEGYLDFPVKNKICGKIIVSNGSEISTMDIEGLSESSLLRKYWKYLSPYTDLWATLNSDNKK